MADFYTRTQSEVFSRSNKHINIQTFDVAVIGAGPVGIFAAFVCGSLDLSCCIIDAYEEPGGQCICLYPDKYIYDIPGIPKIIARDLIHQLVKQSSVFNPTYKLSTIVTGFEQHNNEFNILDKNNIVVKSRTIMLATGPGLICPHKLEVEGANHLEGKKLFYNVENKNYYKDKVVLILGGGDSAVDWAIQLSNIAKHIYLIHRRSTFSAMPYLVDRANNTRNINVITSTVVSYLNDNKENIHVSIHNTETNQNHVIYIDVILVCFGLKISKNIKIHDNLDTCPNGIVIKPNTYETNMSGVYAIGDSGYYTEKRKLILCGFSEASVAAMVIRKKLNPDKAIPTNHSTSNPIFQKI